VLKKFQNLLHDYKKEVFRAEHDKRSAEQIATECLHVTEGVLEQKFNYHLHKLPDAGRAEIINMINNYVREAILPPLVEQLISRQVIMERRIDALVHLVEQLTEVISADEESVQS